MNLKTEENLDDDTIKVVVSNSAINYELKIKKWAMNENTRVFLLTTLSNWIKDVLGGYDE